MNNQELEEALKAQEEALIRLLDLLDRIVDVQEQMANQLVSVTKTVKEIL